MTKQSIIRKQNLRTNQSKQKMYFDFIHLFVSSKWIIDMSKTSRLNKALWTNITRLKLLNKPDIPVKFILEKSPYDDIEEEKAAIPQDEYVIIGRISPNSKIYKDYAVQIEIKLTSAYPKIAPTVRFLTRVYHPNVEPDGTFCHQLLSNASRWKEGTSLVDVVTAVVKHLDEPDPLYPANSEILREYMENAAVFDRKALEMVKRYGLPRI